MDFKFNNKKYLHRFFAQSLVDKINCYQKLEKIKFDYIISVPISFFRYLDRGYNQSYLVANYISKHLQLPVLKFCLVKIIHNPRQSELSYKERALNTKDVYRVINNHSIKNKSILLIDDIFTTGATVNECARILKKAGARKVVVAVCAKA